jgi:mannitol-1-phosphate/altronate dehydrogenase
LVKACFPGNAKTSTERDLEGVVQTEVAERLMILAANPAATTESQSAALAGVHQVQDAMKRTMARNAILDRLEHEITLFLQNPSQNTPRLKTSGAPAGPPV